MATEHLEKHKVIHKSQYGFTKGRLSVTNLLSFLRRVYEEVDNDDKYVIIPYINLFRILFDRVSQQRLLNNI